MNVRTILITTSVLSLAACAGELDDNTAQTGSQAGRGALYQTLSQANGECDAPTSFGDIGAITGEGLAVDNLGSASAELDDGWTLHIDVWTRGQPLSDFSTGDYDLSTMADYADCAPCILMFKPNGAALLADGGTAHIDALEPAVLAEDGLSSSNGSLKGSLENVTFRRVSFDENGFVGDVEGGCKTTIERATFDVTLVYPIPDDSEFPPELDEIEGSENAPSDNDDALPPTPDL